MQLTQLLAAGLLSGFVSAKTAPLSRRAVECYFETLPDLGATCESFAETWGLAGGAAEFMGLNPSVQCPTLDASKAYCAMGTFTIEDPPATSAEPSSTTLPSSTQQPAPSATQTSNGITTPVPAQPSMYTDCDAFYLVKAGDTCLSIAAAKGIYDEQFLRWNSIKADCSDIRVDYYTCISLIGQVPGPARPQTPTTTTATPPQTTLVTSTKVATPTPVVPDRMPGVSTECDLFHKVESGDTCRDIAIKYDITQPQFKSWNTEVNESCSNLWLDYEVCVHIPGAVKLMPGTIADCTKFHTVVVGDTCSVVAAAANITLADLREWNTQINAGCSNLLLGYAVCTGF